MTDRSFGGLYDLSSQRRLLESLVRAIFTACAARRTLRRWLR